MSDGEEAKPRPSHLIRRDQVAAWLSDSAVKQITAHWTSEDSAQRIREVGVRIEDTAVDSKWGQGFYTTTRPRLDYGEVGVRVAVRLVYPLTVEDQILAQELIDDWLMQYQTEDIRAVLKAEGYDGVVIDWDSGETWAVAFDASQVKVIRED